MNIVATILVALVLSFASRIGFMFFEDRFREWRQHHPARLVAIFIVLLVFVFSALFVGQFLPSLELRIRQVMIPLPIPRLFEYRIDVPSGHISIASAFYIATAVMLAPLSLELMQLLTSGHADEVRGKASNLGYEHLQLTAPSIAMLAGFVIVSYKNAVPRATVAAPILDAVLMLAMLGLVTSYFLSIWVNLIFRERRAVSELLLRAVSAALAWTSLGFAIWA